MVIYTILAGNSQDNYPVPLNPPALNRPQMTWEIKSTTVEDKSDVEAKSTQVKLGWREAWKSGVSHYLLPVSSIRLTEHPLSPYLPCLCQSVLLSLWLSLKIRQNNNKKIHSNPALVLSLNWGGRSSIYSLNQQMGRERYQHRFPRNNQKRLCSEQYRWGSATWGF